MSALPILPEWVKPQTIAHHKPSYTLFPILNCQKHRSSGRLLLLDAPKGERGVEYPLDECEPASLAHFSGVALITVGGRPVTVTKQGNLYIFSNGKTRAGVLVDDLNSVARDFAQFFNGEIVQGEVVF